MNIQFRNLPQVIEYLKSLPRGVVRPALRAIGEYLIGNGMHGLKRYQPYRYITRRRAYGKVSDAPAGFFSWAQFRYVMAKIHEGRIDPGAPHRTGNTQRAWRMVITNNGYRVRIENLTRGAVYTRHDRLQARLNALAGWRKAGIVIQSNIKGALRHAGAEIKKFLRSRRK